MLMVSSSLVGAVAAVGAISAATNGPGLGLLPSSPSGSPSSAPPLVTPAATTPSFTVSPTSGYVGTVVTFNVTYFHHASGITITGPGGVTICSGTSSSKGNFTCTYVIPATQSGSQTYSATDSASKPDTGSAVFDLLPRLLAIPASGLVGTPITFLGTGFAVDPTDKVQVTWSPPGGGTAFACSNKTPSDTNGTFTCSFILPSAPAGEHGFLATSINATINTTGYFDVVAGLTVAPTHGPDGTPLTFAGTGFGASVSVEVSWTEGSGTACTSATLNTGSFSCSMTIPAGTPGGSYLFTGSDGTNSASATFIITNLAVAPVAGAVNSTVVFSGSGFAPSSQMNLSWHPLPNETIYACVGTPSSSGGTYSCTFHIPATPGGAYHFNASDGRGDYATTVLTVEPFLSVSPSYGENGTVARFAGTGFGASVPVTVTWSPNGSSQTAFAAATAANGSFSSTFTINVTKGGPYVFTATDPKLDTAATTFEVSLLTATPAQGPNGTRITLMASGFAPNATITLSPSSFASACKVGGSAKTGETTAEGGYECNTTAPYEPPALYVLTAKVGSNQASATFAILPHLFAPPKVKVGASLKFSSTGFAATSLVSVTWAKNGTLACSNTTLADGAINCTLAHVPPTAAGAYTFTAKDPDGNSATTTVTVVPTLSVKPTTGKSGTEANFTGVGFGASVTTNVTSTLGTTCTTTTNASGSFACSYTIPNAPSGKYNFTATDALANKASVNFTIGPSFSLSPTSGPVGTLIAFSGTGFTPGKTANVTLNLTGGGPGKILACSGTISASGDFSCSYAFPQETPGEYTFTVMDFNYPKIKTGNTANGTFKLVPSLAVSPGSGPVGTAVTFLGQGYAADVGISVTWSGGTACTSATNATGTFSCAYTIHAAPAGPLMFTAETSAQVSASVNFTVLSQLTLAPGQGAVGTTIALNGTGFAPLAPVSISWSGGTACAITSTTQGSFVCPSYVVPASPAGSYVFTASVNGTPISTAPFKVEPSLTVNPSSGPVGTKVTFRATGFAASTTITVSSSLGTACSGGKTQANGSYLCNYTIPQAPGGSYSFTATDGTNSAAASFTLGAVLTVSPGLGPVGTAIEFNASGFAKSTAITITWTGGTICSGTTTATGTYTCLTTMPAAPLGSQTFSATAGPTATTTFTVRPALTVSPGSGPDETVVTFNGTGFPASVKVTVTWSDGPPCNNTTGSTGAFTCSLTIPLGTPGGPYTFTATDTRSDQANATFTVVTGLLDTPDHGPALTSVTFIGTNFAKVAGVQVNVTWAVNGTAVCSGTTAANGTFTCAFKIPASTAGGGYTFTATDASTTASVLFVVTYLTAAPTGLVVGEKLNLTGGGFTPGASYSVLAQGPSPWSACSGKVGSAGTFTCTGVKVPSGTAPGAYVFNASDGTDVATAGFGVFSIQAPTSTPSGSVDVGQTVTFSVTASGGSGTLKYAWNGLPSGCVSTTASITCSPSAPVTNASITVTVTDPKGFNVTSPALVFTVYVDPTQKAAKPSHPSADLDQPVTFTAQVTGGSGGDIYVWAWHGADLNCTATSGAVLSCVPNATGSYVVSYNWTDSNGVPAKGNTTLSFTVNPRPTQAAPKPSQSAADVGQTVTFTATVSGGSGGGTYVWSWSSGLGCTSTNLSKLTCDPSTTTGSPFTVSYAWTDSVGIAATGTTTLPYTVDADPTVGTPTATPTSVDVNQSVTFKVTASGGSGGLSYDWLGLPTGCSGSSASFSCKPSAAVTGASITVKVNDTNGFFVTSGALTFTVYTDPTVSKPVPTNASADVGQTVNFTATASGGAGTLTYTWSYPTSAFSCTGASTIKLSCKATAAVVNGSFTLKVEDPNSFNATSPVLAFTVYIDPTQAPAKPSQASADVGQTVTFTAAVTGGLGPGTFAWTAPQLNCTATTGATLTCTPSTAVGEPFSVSYLWTDANHVVATGSTASTFTVYIDPTVTSPTPSRATGSGDVGQPTTFTTTTAGGSGGYTYAWSASSPDLGCASSTTAQIVCTAVEKGNYTLTVTATDSNGVKSKPEASATFQVFVVPSVTAPSPNHPGTDVNEPVTFSTTPSGGSGSYTFAWTTPTVLGCAASTSSTIECTPSKAISVDTIQVVATDSNGFPSAPAVLSNYTVDNAITLTTIIPSGKTADVGEAITFAETPAGGTGIYTYTWTAPTQLNCTLVNASKIGCVPTMKGNYTVTVTVIDSNKATSQPGSINSYQIYAAPAVTVPSPSSKTTDIGIVVAFSTTASGGSGADVYTWTVLPSPGKTGLGCTIHTPETASLACNPNASGNYTISVTITDSNGVTSVAGVLNPFTVYAKPTAVLTVSPGTVLQGHQVKFTGSASGGSGGYTYSWENLPSGCTPPTGATLTCSPSDSGTFTVIFEAKDSNNASAVGNATLTIQPEFLGLPAWEGYTIVVVGIIGAIVAVAVVVTILIRRRRTKRQQMQF